MKFQSERKSYLDCKSIRLTDQYVFAKVFFACKYMKLNNVLNYHDFNSLVTFNGGDDVRLSGRDRGREPGSLPMTL